MQSIPPSALCQTPAHATPHHRTTRATPPAPPTDTQKPDTEASRRARRFCCSVRPHSGSGGSPSPGAASPLGINAMDAGVFTSDRPTSDHRPGTLQRQRTAIQDWGVGSGFVVHPTGTGSPGLHFITDSLSSMGGRPPILTFPCVQSL